MFVSLLYRGFLQPAKSKVIFVSYHENENYAIHGVILDLFAIYPFGLCADSIHSCQNAVNTYPHSVSYLTVIFIAAEKFLLGNCRFLTQHRDVIRKGPGAFLPCYLTPDNNACENAISSCGIYSLIETARQNRIIPANYLTALFEKAPRATSAEDWKNLLPWNIFTA